VDLLVLSVFLIVYVGMILGEIPGLALDRSGIALLGAIAILARGRLTLDEAVLAADAHTLALLFGLMVISAQFRLGGFYTEIVRRIAAHSARTETPAALGHRRSRRAFIRTCQRHRLPGDDADARSRSACGGGSPPFHFCSRSRARRTSDRAPR
jgi:hypothetical protein